jgi:site-specific recombinase
MKSALVPMNMSLKSLNSAFLLGFFDQDLQLLDVEAVLGKAVKRLEQGGKQQAAAAEEFGVVGFNNCRSVFLRTPGGLTMVLHISFGVFF